PSEEKIRAGDIAISPTGKELPPGSGSAKEGTQLYAQKCAACHGATGYGGRAPQLIRTENPTPPPGGKAPLCLSPCIRNDTVMGIYSPYATTLWDFINRGMPFGNEGTLTANEAYALTAFLLKKMCVITEDQVVSPQRLRQIKMPNGDGYVLPPDWRHGMPGLPNKP